MPAYDRSFLERRGYLGQEGEDTVRVDGDELAFVFDPVARLAYFEAVEPSRHRPVVSELRSVDGSFDFYWFWNPSVGRVTVYSRYGEHRWFVYDQSAGLADDARRRKESRLEAVDDGLETLFDVQAAFDQFYRNLWNVRLDIARSLEAPGGTEISDGERLMAAQRTIDRLVFCYFLTQRDVVHGIDDAGNRFGIAPEEMFETVVDSGEFYSFLTETFFTHLNAEGWTEHRVTEGISIAYPYLNDGLFRDHELPTEAGDTIDESELDATSCDWSTLVDELNRYDWSLVESPSDAAGEDSDRLSPAVLGHVFERFVVTVSELTDEGELSLEELEETTASASGEQMLEGNREVGAYYTPNYIAYENTRETLWNRVRTVLAEEHGVDRAAIPSPESLFEQLASADESLPLGLDDVECALEELTVLDPAAGSGAFLTAAGEILEIWRCRCTEVKSRYEIRRGVLRTSLYGVDLLDGAVEICKLRLWLWLTEATTVDLDADEPTVETLPDIGCNIKRGNSLVGVAKPECDSLVAHPEFDWTDGERKSYPDAVADYRENVLAYQAASGSDAAELRQTVTAQQKILQDEFDDVLASESDVTVEEDVDSYVEFTRVVDDIAGAVKLNLDFYSAMTDDERQTVADAGFREQQNWQTTAYHPDVRTLPPESVESIFELMEDRGAIRIERPIAPADVEALDPFHWIFEFPTAYAPLDEDGRAFDVVVGNPPHGSSLSALQKSLLAEGHSLVEGGREVAKAFTERSWSLTDGELSYVVPKASTYNSNWEDFREYCLPKMYRGLDLGRAFRDVDHEQVTIHLSHAPNGESYECGPLPEGTYHLDDTADIDRSFAERLGTLPVSFSSGQQAVAKGLGRADFPTLGDEVVDAGRGASTTNRVDDIDAPLGYNGRQIRRYFTRVATDRVDVDALSDAVSSRLESPKVMAQNIVAHVQNPYDHLVIAAVYDPVSSYDFETVTNVVLPEDSRLSPSVLAALLNTQFVNWFVYVTVFNRAVRDMHLDRHFLERIVLPRHVTETQREAIEQLYGLLAISNVATEWESLPDGRSTYAELQSITNALTYEMYLTDVDEPTLQTRLAETVHETLEGHETEYRTWYAEHLRSVDRDDVEAAFHANSELYEAAERVVASLGDQRVTETLETIAGHPWVEVIERGQQWGERGARPHFGPNGVE